MGPIVYFCSSRTCCILAGQDYAEAKGEYKAEINVETKQGEIKKQQDISKSGCPLPTNMKTAIKKGFFYKYK